MEIELNGVPHQVDERHNVQQLIASLELGGQTLAVAVNRSIVPRQRWAEHVLQPQDRVDIVRAMGGG
ncbi:MAG: sulfur carrier protein ThiS [Wenzhouxiangellaceae bacterium]|nr:sulfur carrier protein ThiS [Wenzhouxiangellaceae bacterium]